MYSQQSSDSKSVRCPVCGSYSVTASDEQIHIQAGHSESRVIAGFRLHYCEPSTHVFLIRLSDLSRVE